MTLTSLLGSGTQSGCCSRKRVWRDNFGWGTRSRRALKAYHQCMAIDMDKIQQGAPKPVCAALMRVIKNT
jgi:hypothetical protein